MTTDLKTTIGDLAKRSLARATDLDRHQEQIGRWERDLAAKRVEIEEETKELALRLATVLEREADLAAKIKIVTGEFATLAAASAAADKARAEYERLTAELRAVLK